MRLLAFGPLFESGTRVKFSKHALGKKIVETLGHRVSHNSILPSDGHVNAIEKLQYPADRDLLFSLIGIVT